MAAPTSAAPSWSIAPPSRALEAAIQARIDNKTKPLGALGRLESLALQIALIQQRLDPQLQQPHMLVFAGDHGAAATPGISAYPQAVTAQMVLNFLQGGAAINGFCQQNGLLLQVIDAGVNADLPAHPQLIRAKIAKGTADYSQGPAMSAQQCAQALALGAEQVRRLLPLGCNCIALGEMGIGNSASAALVTQCLTGLPLVDLVGPGTGLQGAALQHKYQRLAQALALHPAAQGDCLQALQAFAGFEMVMLVGACLEAAQQQLLILVDGYIASAAVLAAVKMHSNALAYCVFCHASQEPGHRQLLAHLQVEALLDLQLRLGEGTGAALAYPLVQAAVTFLNSMASFEHAGVSRAI
jgi:nicotinate-nucleotide--dimethylbenzimidazole phosphoribosyltransferase